MLWIKAGALCLRLFLFDYFVDAALQRGGELYQVRSAGVAHAVFPPTYVFIQTAHLGGELALGEPVALTLLSSVRSGSRFSATAASTAARSSSSPAAGRSGGLAALPTGGRTRGNMAAGRPGVRGGVTEDSQK